MADTPSPGGFRVCIDIGGTFTDCVVSDSTRTQRIFKTPSTPAAFEQGFMSALSLAAGGYGFKLPDFMARVERIVHGTTVSTNALLEGKHAAVGLICTHGFRDILTLREAPRKPPFHWRLSYPEPFVPRLRTRGVRGRIDAAGAERVPLAEDDVLAAVEDFRKLGVEAVAVCLLWSVVNGSHERRVGEIVRSAWPEVPVTLSHRLNPIAREYRRAVSAAIDAALRPVVSAYVHALERDLRASGYGNELMIANCLGGMMPPEEIAERPIYSVMSGPTLAPVAARKLAEAPDLVVVDMGGTSFDVSAVRDGQLVISPEAMLTDFDMLGIPKVDVRSVGAGGGSIAHVDAGGLLRVGPESAGADPGPACYGLGGTRPTVTDADVVLGLIDPDYFLGGRMRLDRAAAETAVGTVADALGIALAAAARTIAGTVDHTMIAAIEDITVQEGIDPRESYFVAGGGATAVHMGQMARVLGIRGYMVPKFSAGLSAFGGLVSDIVWEETGTLVTDAARFELAGVNRVLATLIGRGRAFLERAGIAPADRRFEFAYLGRYQYQSWEIEVPFVAPDGAREDAQDGAREGVLAAADVAGLADSFHRMHERIYTIKNEDDLVEFTTWKVRAIGPAAAVLAPAARAASPQVASPQAARPHGTRRVHLPGRDGSALVPVYRGDDLDPGATIAGPAIVEEATTTVLVPEEAEAVVDTLGNYRVTLEYPG